MKGTITSNTEIQNWKFFAKEISRSLFIYLKITEPSGLEIKSYISGPQCIFDTFSGLRYAKTETIGCLLFPIQNKKGKEIPQVP